MQTAVEALQKGTIRKKLSRSEPPAFLDIPNIDMYAEDGELVTEVLLPEFNEDEVVVTATSEGMEISAIRSSKAREDEDKTYIMREGRQSYWRRLSLPRGARPETMKQEFRNGKLRITMSVGETSGVSEKELMRRKEIGHDLCGVVPKTKSTKAFGFRNQEFPNHWTRYRPVR